MEGVVVELIFFSVQETETELGAIQTLKESLDAVHTVCWKLNRTSKSKRADNMKNCSAVDSWLSFTTSSTVNSISLSGTASGMLGKIVDTT